MIQVGLDDVLIAGRGTDLLIHRKVMRWKHVRTKWFSFWRRKGALGWEFCRKVPPYSTKVTAALLVADELEKQGWTFSMLEQVGEKSGWVVTRIRFIKPDQFVERTDVLRATAICGAALKVVEPPP